MTTDSTSGSCQAQAPWKRESPEWLRVASGSHSLGCLLPGHFSKEIFKQGNSCCTLPGRPISCESASPNVRCQIFLSYIARRRKSRENRGKRGKRRGKRREKNKRGKRKNGRGGGRMKGKEEKEGRRRRSCKFKINL